MTDLLCELGKDSAYRDAAKAMNWGIGHVKQIVRQNGDDFEIETVGQRSMKSVFSVGCGACKTTSTDGEDILITSEWRSESGNQVVVSTIKLVKDGTDLPTVKRYLSGKDMVTELCTVKGVVVKRTFSRQ